MHLKEIAPKSFLATFVKCYRIIDFEFEPGFKIPPKIYTPRPEHCLQFFPCKTIIDYDDVSIVPKNATLFGQHNITNLRTVFSKFLSVQIVFQAGALFRLTGISAKALFNTAIEAAEVFGNEVNDINEKLYYAKNHDEMIAIIESFILRKVMVAKKSI